LALPSLTKPYLKNRTRSTFCLTRHSCCPLLSSLRVYVLSYTKSVRKSSVDGICPYLTFEVKKTPDILQTEAENQISAASTFWLHRRCALRAKANETYPLAGKPFQRSLCGLSHYSFVIFGHRFFVYVTDPILKDQTTGVDNEDSVIGYSTRKPWHGWLDLPCSVSDYETWQRYIHRWVLGPFLESAKEDVSILTASSDAEETSIIEGAAGMTIGS
jgi:hypothetical protein